jgi:23S rRNA (adenine1618-N6)-methyltransferase
MTNDKNFMHLKKKDQPKEKPKLHARNKHRERYDFKQLLSSCPALVAYVKPNIYGDESIDFFDPEAVKTLNKALLLHHYGIENWDIPPKYLCPPIPGRADYIHHLTDVLGSKNYGKIPQGAKIKCLDIGVGANCVYPFVGNKEYGWSFVGSDIDPVSIENAAKIIASNPHLDGQIELRLQPNPKDIFQGIIQPDELFDATVCNPPFHATMAEALAGTQRKLANLKPDAKVKKSKKPVLNFGGQNGELWCEGGEVWFVGNMVRQSKQFAQSCFWFSTLISKETHLKGVYDALKKAEAAEVKTVAMGQGNKTSRIVAWTFLTAEEQKAWKDKRWK